VVVAVTILFAALLLVVVPLIARHVFVVKAADSFVLACGLVLVLALAPFLVPQGMYFWRACLATLAVSCAIKVVEIKNRRFSDASVATNLGRFLVWCFVPPDVHWARNEAERLATRRGGLKRLRRGLGKCVLYLAMCLASNWGYTNGLPYVVAIVWTATQFYLFMTLLLDGLAALVMFFGVAVDEIFDAPFVARSPSDFWSRRWNLYVSRFAARYIFLPLGSSRKRFLATIAVFAASGIMHEYLVLAIFWTEWKKLGYMALFFGLQGLAVGAHHTWIRLTRGRARLRPAFAVLLHSLWFLPGTALFFEPLGVLLGIWGISWWPLPF
jgi:hypothetical protein